MNLLYSFKCAPVARYPTVWSVGIYNLWFGEMLSFLLMTLCSLVVFAQYQPNWDSLNSRPLPKWYDESKFGIILHWGVYSVPSFHSEEEWFWNYWKTDNDSDIVKFMEQNYPPGFEYQDFAPMFKAELFDPKAWADLFQKSGARYNGIYFIAAV